jgi:hypothetical protein
LNFSSLLNYLWRAGYFTGREFASLTGERVAIVATGEADDELRGVWHGAEVTVDEERRRGSVAIGEETPVPDGAVLRVVEGDTPPVLGVDDRLVTQIHCEPPAAAIECYDTLRRGAGEYACAARISEMMPVHRTALYTALLVERLQRKTARVAEIFAASNHDWHQTLHVMLLRSMGGDRNREAFTTLAGRATSAMVSREKGSVVRVEALLLGAAGFLFAGNANTDFDGKDDYTLRLEEEARHLLAKYSIVPMKPAVWDLSRLYPVNHPAVRLAELASLLSKRDFMLDGVLDCLSSEDVERLFMASASEYWRTHFTPSGEVSEPSTKSIGRAKARLVGINLVAPLMFAYGRQTGREELCERALDLLATIPPEKNRLLAGWYAGGCEAESAFDSQALLQLWGEYCTRRACADCRIGRSEIKKSLA